MQQPSFSIKRYFRHMAASAFLVLTLAACSGNEAAPTVSTPAAEATATTAVEEPTATPAETTDQPDSEETTTETETTADTPEANAEPAEEEVVEEATATTEAETDTIVDEVASAVNLKFNLNEATSEDFLTIPDVGDRMVREFFEYRPYVSIQQFRREIGKYVDEQQVAAYEQFVFVPVNVNESDEATLQQLPGVDETISAALAAARPYESTEAFLTKLAEYVSAEDVAMAATYLVSQ
jgi:DNA uptake protein ComE-like DNA-binding protein